MPEHSDTATQQAPSPASTKRLEPTLTTVGLRGLIHRQPTDGVQITLRGPLVDADINIATNDTHQARALTQDLCHRILEHLTTTGHEPGTITINVLTIDPATAG